jgi:hypothetical protein
MLRANAAFGDDDEAIRVQQYLLETLPNNAFLVGHFFEPTMIYRAS